MPDLLHLVIILYIHIHMYVVIYANRTNIQKCLRILFPRIQKILTQEGYIRPMSGYICVLFISKTTYIVACMLCEPSSYPAPPSLPQSANPPF